MRIFTMLLGLLISSFAATGADMSNGADNFYKSDKVTQKKVTFKNQYQMSGLSFTFSPEGQVNRQRYKPLFRQFLCIQV